MGIGLIFTTFLAPAVTQLVNTNSLGLDIPTGFASYTVMSDASLPTSYGLYYLFKAPVIIAIVVSLLLVVGMYFLKRNVKLENVLGKGE
jgi:hypothetical protein